MRKLLAVGVVLLLTAACVGNRQYQSSTVLEGSLLPRQFDPTQPECDPKLPGCHFSYRLAFIEFDDRGEMFDRRQLAAVLEAIAATKKAGQEAEAKRDPARNAIPIKPVVLFFVHGWKNNASESSGNVWGFRQMLAGMNMEFRGAPVLGIYVGWRGATVSAPILKEFTFFNRRRKSQNLADAHMVEALLKMLRAAKGPDFSDTSTITTMIGHSFGGAVLETALIQSIMNMVLQPRTGERGVQWPADLTILLNEAQEAIRSYQLIEALHSNLPPRGPCPAPDIKIASKPPNPAIISLSSTGDTATRVAFPAAQSLIRPFQSLRTYEEENFLGIKRQTPMFLNTTAHMRAFRTHLMGREDDPAIMAARKVCREDIRTQINGIFYNVVENPDAKNRTAYWAMQMSPDVVPDHSTIFGPAFRAFLTNLIHQVTMPEVWAANQVRN